MSGMNNNSEQGECDEAFGLQLPPEDQARLYDLIENPRMPGKALTELMNLEPLVTIDR